MSTNTEASTEATELEQPQEKIETERKVVITKTLSKDYRNHFDDVIANMFSNPKYIDYNFYAHVLAQCKVHFDPSLKAPAAVSFSINHYKLWINPEEFNLTTLEHGLGILKHEMLHILNNHCTVRNYKSDNHKLWNIAYDMAINQLVNREHLPEGCIYPDQFQAPKNKSGEQYFDFLKDKAQDQMNESCPSCGGSGHSDEDCSECNGSGEGEDGEPCEHCNGSGKEHCKDCGGSGNKYNPLDDHGKWAESEGNDELRKDITKGMLEKAISKSRGNVPQNIDAMIQLFSRNAQVSWRRELRNIVGNRRVNKTRTIMRPNRRQPNRIELKGNKKDRLYDLCVICDVSGSMSNEEIANGLNEITHICKMTNTNIKIIQVDTEVHEVTTFDKNSKNINRSGCGGTTMYPAIEYIRAKGIEHDAIIFITDGYIEDISRWEKPPRCKTMFLVTQETKIPGIESYSKYKQFNLKSI